MKTTRFSPKLVVLLFGALGVCIFQDGSLYAGAIAGEAVPLWKGPITTEHGKLFIDASTFLLAVCSLVVALNVYLQQKDHDQKLAADQIAATARQAKASEDSDRLKRFEKFQEFGKQFSKDPAVSNVLQFLKNPAAQKPSPSEMHFFMQYYEELKIMVNSGLVKPDVAYWTRLIAP